MGTAVVRGRADAAGVGDLVAAAVEELYGADPQAFTERRAELAAAARDAGDRAAAKAIAALRRPTRAAWVVNQLARTDPSGPAKLAELGCRAARRTAGRARPPAARAVRRPRRPGRRAHRPGPVPGRRGRAAARAAP